MKYDIVILVHCLGTINIFTYTNKHVYIGRNSVLNEEDICFLKIFMYLSCNFA